MLHFFRYSARHRSNCIAPPAVEAESSLSDEYDAPNGCRTLSLQHMTRCLIGFRQQCGQDYYVVRE